MEAYHLWLIGGLLLAACEMLTGDLTLLSIGIATGSTAVPAWLGWSTEACLAWLAVTNLLVFIALRPALRRWVMRDSPAMNSNSDGLVGNVAVVSIEHGAPWARTGGDHWRLESDEDLAEGQKVVVVGVEGSRLQVEPASQTD